MHVHGHQMNPAFAMNTVYAAQQAQAKQRAEATRKKLFESASLIAGESEDCIVTIGERQGDGDHQERNSQRNDAKPECAKDGDEVQQVSDWA